MGSSEGSLMSGACKFEPLSTWALTRTLVRTKPSSNVDLRVHARASLVRVNPEFERFDHVGSQNSSFSEWRAPG
jgi:hypothetical protein